MWSLQEQLRTVAEQCVEVEAVLSECAEELEESYADAKVVRFFGATVVTKCVCGH